MAGLPPAVQGAPNAPGPAIIPQLAARGDHIVPAALVQAALAANGASGGSGARGGRSSGIGGATAAAMGGAAPVIAPPPITPAKVAAAKVAAGNGDQGALKFLAALGITAAGAGGIYAAMRSRMGGGGGASAVSAGAPPNNDPNFVLQGEPYSGQAQQPVDAYATEVPPEPLQVGHTPPPLMLGHNPQGTSNNPHAMPGPAMRGVQDQSLQDAMYARKVAAAKVQAQTEAAYAQHGQQNNVQKAIEANTIHSATGQPETALSAAMSRAKSLQNTENIIERVFK